MLFSVIIPTYNRAALLREALDSVLAQKFTDFEVIVVDDGSTDDTATVAAAYGDRIRFMRQTNAGPGAARNLGLQHATGRYVAFLDSDDVWFPWTLSSFGLLIGKCQEPTFVCGDCIRFSRADEITAVHPANMVYQTFADYYAAWSQNIWVLLGGVAIRADVLARSGGFPEGFINAEDSDLWMNLGTAPGFAHLRAPIVLGYRANPESASKAQSKTFEGIRQIVLKEQTGKYPGGLARQRERRHILTAHVRPASLGCLRSKNLQGAWWLYRKTFRWHLSLGRLRYLLALPVFAAISRIKVVSSSRSGSHCQGISTPDPEYSYYVPPFEFCPVLAELLKNQAAVGRSGKRFDSVGAISTKNNLWALRKLAMELRPIRTVEIGLAFGGSALVFTASHRDLRHTPARQHLVLDPFESSVWDDCGLQAIEQAGLTGYLDFRPSVSSLELPRLVGEGARFDLVYVDGSHLVEDVFVDAYFVTRLLVEGGVVAFDDSADPHVHKVLKFLRANLRASVEEIDLAQFRADRGTTLRYRMARMLGKVQMTAFRRVGKIDRAWNTPFHPF